MFQNHQSRHNLRDAGRIKLLVLILAVKNFTGRCVQQNRALSRHFRLFDICRGRSGTGISCSFIFCCACICSHGSSSCRDRARAALQNYGFYRFCRCPICCRKHKRTVRNFAVSRCHNRSGSALSFLCLYRTGLSLRCGLSRRLSHCYGSG